VGRDEDDDEQPNRCSRAPALARLAAEGGHVLRIVIAEPDEALTSWLADAIAPAQGFEVVGTARDGESALDTVRRTHPDVVLVDADIDMPPDRGLTLVAAVLKALPETLVVVLAAQDFETTAQAAMALGAAGLLAKDGSVQIPEDLGWPDLGSGPGPGPSLTRSAS
jgi:ActR/RegA family two-component response regulator